MNPLRLAIVAAAFDFSRANPLQITLAIVMLVWSLVSLLFLLLNKAFQREPDSTPGLFLILKYSPPLWRKITIWLGPLWILLLVISLFL